MPVTLASLPEQIRDRVKPEAPAPLRMMAARALLPMGPDDLLVTLAYLSTNATGELAAAARKSLGEMPPSVLGGVVRASTDADVLDFTLRELSAQEEILEPLILNRATPDAAIEWAARRVSGRALEMIGNNQERILRHGKIVEAIYFNPAAPMAIVTRAFETAIRNGVDLKHIPGYREIYESIFGRDAAHAEAARLAAEQAADALDEEPVLDLDVEIPQIPPEELVPVAAEDEGAPEDEFLQALAEASRAEASGEAPAEDEARQNMFGSIQKMNAPQRVRLALIGNSAARAILIKDSKTIVAMSVLKNPMISEKEVAGFAKQKSISEQIITAIARNREWTRSYAVQYALIYHPKTPAAFVNRWIRMLKPRELKELSRSRDVPGFVARLAKNLLTMREKPGS